ncbi:hypothetical protein H5410_051508 [Solanum commersonii]|uniref:Uncharacterized protein n=1 Tax=Solanum commersonii TaxID=4109 RepID=A0A9J5WYD1_SOLCO|nr:hypothetical protein H5410_051508 [Solanum commersonii]
MYGHIRRDNIRNKVIQNKEGVAPVDDKMRDVKLRWIGHVKRICAYASVMRCTRLAVVDLMRGIAEGLSKTTSNFSSI